jgi:ubiquinone/menaquinone biosynthesis C-methylase UbiE
MTTSISESAIATTHGVTVKTHFVGRPINSEPLSVVANVQIACDIVVDLNVCIDFYGTDASAPLYSRFMSADGWDICWIPKGEYQVRWSTPRLALPSGVLRAGVRVYGRVAGVMGLLVAQELPFSGPTNPSAAAMAVVWEVDALGSSPPFESLAWHQGHKSWFFQHFDHASRTTIEYICGDSPLMRGRVLDVGCGDGVTDLGIALRYGPKELIGIDPFKGFERLPQILKDNHLGHLAIPKNLRFMAEDGNALPFPDNSFDALISWGSIEHMAGGYARALNEMKRVLKPDGLLFIAPGLFYSNIGHHLGEFSTEPFFHLTKTHEEVRDIVFNSPATFMDRSGLFATRAEYWQWYNELNKITVPKLDEELRALGFEIWRAALRCEPLVEYKPGMFEYRICDLAPSELYSSWYNRK